MPALAVKDTLKGLFGVKKMAASAPAVSVLRVRAVTEESL